MTAIELQNLFKESANTPEYQFEETVVDLTEQLCEIMQAQGVSRAELARRLGKSRAWVTKVLRGDQNLTLRTITDVFWVLGYAAKVEAKPSRGPQRCSEAVARRLSEDGSHTPAAIG